MGLLLGRRLLLDEILTFYITLILSLRSLSYPSSGIHNLDGFYSGRSHYALGAIVLQ
jgi:hypothetical protein